jgi:hypothetical protein
MSKTALPPRAIAMLGTVADQVIADKFRIAHRVVWAERRRRGIHKAPSVVTKQKSAVDVQAAKALLAQNHSLRDIARRFGVTAERVRQLTRGCRRVVNPKQPRGVSFAANQQRIRSLVLGSAKSLTVPQIAVLVGRSEGFVRKLLHENRVHAVPVVRECNRIADERRRRVRELRAQGMMIKDIAKDVGLSIGRVGQIVCGCCPYDTKTNP